MPNRGFRQITIGTAKAALVIALLLGLSLWTSYQVGGHMRAEAERDLVSLVNVMAVGLQTQYRHVLSTTRHLAAHPQVKDATARLRYPEQVPAATTPLEVQDTLRQQLNVWLDDDFYRGFLVVAPDRLVLAASHDGAIGELRVSTFDRVWEGEALVSLPQLHNPLDAHGTATGAYVSTQFAAAPIRDESHDVIAILILQLAPERILYDLLQAGMAGASGDSYAFDRSGLMLSESRFTETLWASGRLPNGQPSFRALTITTPNDDRLTRLAASATRGEDGVDVAGYRDYRGVEVVGAWRWLENEGLGIAVEIDAAEMFGSLRQLQIMVIFSTLVASLLFLALAQLTKRQQQRLEAQVADRTMALASEQRKLSNLFDQAADGLIMLDEQGLITAFNRCAQQTFGLTAAEALGRPLQMLFAAPVPQPTGVDAASHAEIDGCHRSGELIPIALSVSVAATHGDNFRLAITRDITNRRQTERTLHIAESVFQHITEGVLVTDSEGRILRVNRALCDMVGYTEQELIGQARPPYNSDEHPAAFFEQIWAALLSSGSWEGEIRNRRRNGEMFPTWQTIVAVRDDHQRHQQFVSVTRDITEQRRNEQRIHRLAYFDPLTDLPNRELFFDRFSHAIARALRQHSGVALLFLDLDRFKNVNDSLGHPVGDDLLVAVAHRLGALMRDEDTIARLGGDEFTVLLESTSQTEQIVEVAQKIIRALSQPFEIGGHRLHIGTSVGISRFPIDGEDATTLVKHADAAMYQAKAAGRNNFQFYTASMTSKSRARITLDTNLHRAIQNAEFTLHYQPQFRANGEIAAVEALIRWQDPLLGLVPPGDFIPLAEDNGLIIPIGEWALHAACAQMRTWLDQGARLLRMSVNLAGPQITRSDLPGTLDRVLNETGLAPHYLELEITETFIMENVELVHATLSDIRKMGVSIAIDDFGTGHSSLAILKRLPADTLKLDRAFVHDLPDDANDVAIARAILAMSKELRLDTVAEGVETQAQMDFLHAEGCDFFQGFLLSRPLPADEVATRWQTLAVD